MCQLKVHNGLHICGLWKEIGKPVECFYFVNTIHKSVQYRTFNCVQTVWIFLLTKVTFWTCCSCSVEYWEWNALTWVHLLANVCVLILCFLCRIGLHCLFFPSDASAEWAKWYCNSFLSTLCVIPWDMALQS